MLSLSFTCADAGSVLRWTLTSGTNISPWALCRRGLTALGIEGLLLLRIPIAA